jgi:hypothetical protein
MNESLVPSQTPTPKPKSDPKLAIAIVVIGVFVSIASYIIVSRESHFFDPYLPQRCEWSSACDHAPSYLVDCGFAPPSRACYGPMSFEYWKILTREGWEHVSNLWSVTAE